MSSEMKDYASLVEPRVGTTQPRWIGFSSASLPFGMVNLSPDTRINGDWGCGYQYRDTQILGVSHLHEWQIGGLLVMPVVGDSSEMSKPAHWASAFSHDGEICKPGDHRFRLNRYGIDVELTATSRVGLHRYHFPVADDLTVMVDLSSTLGPSDMGNATLRQTGPRRLEGQVTNLPTIRRPKPLEIYFAIELDCDGTLTGTPETHASEQWCELAGHGVVGRLSLGTGGKSVVMKVAISYTSIAGAWKNLNRECPGFDFDAIRTAANAEWNRWLSRIEIEGGTAEERGRFYTDLYFSILGRRTVSDCDGQYIDNTGLAPVVRQIPTDSDGAPLYRHFNSDSFWGAQWSITPLWLIVYPQIVDEFCRCFFDMYQNGGLIPRGPAGGNYTFVMTSAQTTPFFVAAILTGVYKPSDPIAVYEAIKKNHLPGGLMSKCGYEHHTAIGGGLQDYLSLGYIPEDLPKAGFHNNGAAQTLEHSYNDWCLSQLAEKLGLASDAAMFAQRAKNYRNLFDVKSGFMRPRLRDGSWLTPYDPMSGRGWTEANGWNFTFYVPHDVAGLVDCFGSKERFIERLEQCLTLSQEKGFVAPHGEHFKSTLDFGNEPPMAVPFLFHGVGRPELTDHWIQKIREQVKSGNSPLDGFGGDEDQGMMGSWGVLTAIGLFSIRGGSDISSTYELCRPAFDYINIHLDPSFFARTSFEIKRRVRTEENPASTPEWAGRSLVIPELSHSQILRGGILTW